MYTCTHASQCNLCMSCVQTCTLLVHWSYCLATPCTLQLYTCLHTGLGTCVHFQAVSKLGHSECHSSVCMCTLQQETPTHRVMLHVRARRAHTRLTTYQLPCSHTPPSQSSLTVLSTQSSLTVLPHTPPSQSSLTVLPTPTH